MHCSKYSIEVTQYIYAKCWILRRMFNLPYTHSRIRAAKPCSSIQDSNSNTRDQLTPQGLMLATTFQCIVFMEPHHRCDDLEPGIQSRILLSTRF